MLENLQLLANISTTIAVVIAVFQLYKQNKQRRIDYLLRLHEFLISNREMEELFYKIDHETFKFNKNLPGSKQEIILDRLLGFFETICRLETEGLFTKSDFSFFEYELLRIVKNIEIKKYFDYLEKETSEDKISVPLFNELKNRQRKYI
ncbi:hypothetical protein [Leptospira vanthielii]|uniref:Uncharacterized protein n=1 Tax=Leptospira vanthielii serovar Holland str. Waz Holland = ATCC 700522 TaxID=1218591 RepID=N1W7C9_9LEPT|nr:hypothetical protein [Leptospira vanthielii]EMY67771.1 hypothetical protein LEP1GSC199_0668 [Leptospira vanthielii serovar Holland str. Waz Holland = ATCC 700522]